MLAYIWTFNCFPLVTLQKNVKKEFHLLTTAFDENLSWYLDDNINRFAKQPKSVNKDDEDFQLSNKMHCKSLKMLNDLSYMGCELGQNLQQYAYCIYSNQWIHVWKSPRPDYVQRRQGFLASFGFGIRGRHSWTLLQWQQVPLQRNNERHHQRIPSCLSYTHHGARQHGCLLSFILLSFSRGLVILMETLYVILLSILKT